MFFGREQEREDVFKPDGTNLVYLDCNRFYPSGCPRLGGNPPVALCQ
jgi:hypothetical protein